MSTLGIVAIGGGGLAIALILSLLSEDDLRRWVLRVLGGRKDGK